MQNETKEQREAATDDAPQSNEKATTPSAQHVGDPPSQVHWVGGFTPWRLQFHPAEERVVAGTFVIRMLFTKKGALWKNKQKVMSQRDMQNCLIKSSLFFACKTKTGFLHPKWPLIGKCFFFRVEKQKTCFF